MGYITKEQMWYDMQKRFPQIREIFDSYILGLRLANYNESSMDITFGKNNYGQPLLRCHIYAGKSQKVFTLYYNKNTDEMFVRNALNLERRLKTNSPGITITTMDELEKLILQSLKQLR